MSSKIGTTTNLGKFLEEWTLQENSDGGAAINLVATSHTQLTKAETGVTKVYTAFGIAPSPTFNSNTTFQPIPAFTTPPLGAGGLEEQYYFHPDHLGSSNYITNIAGDVSQHMEYFAFGETFVEEHKNSINSPYKFNGKELDEESGLYYYGARYYDPRLSIWASVDPLANFNPFMDDEHYIDGDHNAGVYNPFNHNSYGYCYQNPVILVDPNGKQTVAPTLSITLYSSVDGTKDVETYNCAGLALRNYNFIGSVPKVISELKSLGGYIGNGKPNEVTFTLWTYDIHLEDSDGNVVTPTSSDFHIVGGVVKKDGSESTDISSKNGKRPLEATKGKASDFKPKPREDFKINNKSNAVSLDSKGKPYKKIRTNMKEFKISVPTIESTAPKKTTTIPKKTTSSKKNKP